MVGEGAMDRRELQDKVRSQALRDMPMLFELGEQEEFQGILRRIRAAPRQEQLERALKLLDVDVMRESGVQLPEGVQGTIDVPSRSFKSPDNAEPPIASVTFEVCLKVPLVFIEVSKCFKVTVENPDIEF
jgi:hypothetical protein